MSFRAIPAVGGELEAFLRTLSDAVDRLQNGGAIKGEISLNDAIRIGDVNVTVTSDGDQRTLTFTNAITGEVIQPYDPAPGPITGQVNSDGTIAAGTGFTVDHSAGAGLYDITFTTPFDETPTILATAFHSGIANFAMISSPTTASVRVTIKNDLGTVHSEDFDFVAFVTA